MLKKVKIYVILYIELIFISLFFIDINVQNRLLYRTKLYIKKFKVNLDFFNTYLPEPLDAGAIIVSFNLLNYKIGLYILLFIVNNIIGE